MGGPIRGLYGAPEVRELLGSVDLSDSEGFIRGTRGEDGGMGGGPFRGLFRAPEVSRVYTWHQR